ncbi:MAG: thermonuclease family protein [Mariprofundaceae bacterium]|nr:thermonuclease family protein [Mariprofundaceae bacterium]
MLIRLFICLCFLPCLAEAGTLSIMGSSSRMVSVDKVFDGDTFKTKTGERVRLLGMNTPEVAHRDSPAQPFGDIASRLLKKMIDGQSVRLVTDKEKKDRYGRTLAHVYLKDNTWINGEIVKQGMAHVYTFAPNFKHAKELNQLEQQARKKDLGIWHHKRYKVLDAAKVSKKHLGQFRVVRGQVSNIKKHRFKLGKISVGIPRKARSYMPELDLQQGQTIVVHGKIRMSRTKTLFMSLYNPTDLEL